MESPFSGIPSHDTFNRVLSALNPEDLEKCFMEWTRSVAELCEHEVIAIDGKSMRGTRDAGKKVGVRGKRLTAKGRMG